MAEQDGLETLTSESPTVRSILTKQSAIVHVGEGSFLQKRTVAGTEYPGSSHQYKVILPSPTKSGETWTTYLTSWVPTSLTPEDFEKNPDPQLYITTGEGEMLFSKNPEIVRKVMKEIYRQMEEQRKAAEAANNKPQT